MWCMRLSLRSEPLGSHREGRIPHLERFVRGQRVPGSPFGDYSILHE